MTKVYIVTLFRKNENDAVILYSEPFGSVTEICNHLKKMFNFPPKESRKLIINAFTFNTKLWIQINKSKSVRISQHKIEIESRVHGC